VHRFHGKKKQERHEKDNKKPSKNSESPKANLKRGAETNSILLSKNLDL